jgi:hypothetical protein
MPNSSHDARVGVHTVATLALSGTPQQHEHSSAKAAAAAHCKTNAKSTTAAVDFDKILTVMFTK